ncbi:MAG: TlpA disulfide reductase family protein [candidate division WOR-3 bacterium]
MKSLNFIIALKSTIFIISLIFLSCHQTQRNYNTPDFTLTDLFGNNVNLYHILDSGRPVLIVTWALWAKESIKELDALLSYTDELESLNIQTLAISMDTKRSVPGILPFVVEHNWIFYYRILLDTADVFRNLYNIQALPTTIAIDRTGDICFNWLGYKSGDEKMIVDTLMVISKDN